jgi:hypothetical protein
LCCVICFSERMKLSCLPPQEKSRERDAHGFLGLCADSEIESQPK